MTSFDVGKNRGLQVVCCSRQSLREGGNPRRGKSGQSYKRNQKFNLQDAVRFSRLCPHWRHWQTPTTASGEISVARWDWPWNQRLREKSPHAYSIEGTE